VSWSLLCADVIEGLAAIRPGSVQCVVTSPPYYGLRSYAGVPSRAWGGDPGHTHEWSAVGVLDPRGLQIGKASSPDARGVERGSFCRCGAWLGCLGLEPSPDLYLSHLVEIFQAVRLAMRPDAVLWLNIGDSYQYSGRGPEGEPSTLEGSRRCQEEARAAAGGSRGRRLPGDGSRHGIPERLVLALRADGWVWRQTVIWSKPSPLPESVGGWRWERCRVKVAGKLRGRHDRHEAVTDGPLKGGTQRGDVGGDAAAKWAPCPGCPKCAPNDGLVLRRGSWRPTTAHEHLYQLTPGPSYFSDGEVVREADKGTDHPRNVLHQPEPSGGLAPPNRGIRRAEGRNGSGRNPRSVWKAEEENPLPLECSGCGEPLSASPGSVWEIPSEAFPGAHFATFPRRLVEPCILSSTPAAGSCSECGAPWAPVVDVGYDNPGSRSTNGPRSIDRRHLEHGTAGYAQRLERRSRTLGHRPICSCGAPPRPALVLDPFAGSGTVGLVAIQHGRRFVGIERSPTYCAMARHRIGSADPEHVAAQPVRMAGISGPLFT
jgi:DNA modification methylase